MAEQNNYNRPSQSSLRQVYVNICFGVEPLFKYEWQLSNNNQDSLLCKAVTEMANMPHLDT